MVSHETWEHVLIATNKSRWEKSSFRKNIIDIMEKSALKVVWVITHMCI